MAVKPTFIYLLLAIPICALVFFGVFWSPTEPKLGRARTAQPFARSAESSALSKGVAAVELKLQNILDRIDANQAHVDKDQDLVLRELSAISQTLRTLQGGHDRREEDEGKEQKQRTAREQPAAAVSLGSPADNPGEMNRCRIDVPLQLSNIYRRWATEADLKTQWITDAPAHQCECTYFNSLAAEKVTPQPYDSKPGACAPDPVGQRPWKVTKDYDVLVTSFGGVGTSFLINTIKTKLNLTVNSETNGDDLKHHPWPPPAELNVSIRSAVFVYDDPAPAVLSLYRRGFHKAQAGIISNRNCKSKSFPASVSAFVQAGADLYPFREFLLNWLHQPTSFPVAFVRLSDLWDHLPELCAFLGLSTASCAGAFPPKRPRKSDNTGSESMKEAIAKAYSRFSLEIDAMPRFLVKPSVTGATTRLDSARAA